MMLQQSTAVVLFLAYCTNILTTVCRFRRRSSQRSRVTPALCRCCFCCFHFELRYRSTYPTAYRCTQCPSWFFILLKIPITVIMLLILTANAPLGVNAVDPFSAKKSIIGSKLSRVKQKRKQRPGHTVNASPPFKFVGWTPQAGSSKSFEWGQWSCLWNNQRCVLHRKMLSGGYANLLRNRNTGIPVTSRGHMTRKVSDVPPFKNVTWYKAATHTRSCYHVTRFDLYISWCWCFTDDDGLTYC